MVGYILTLGLDSTNQIGPGALISRKCNKSDRPDLLGSGLRLLMSDDNCIFSTILIHDMLGYIQTEKIALKDKRHISLLDITKSMSQFEEDILYIVDKGVIERRRQTPESADQNRHYAMDESSGRPR